MSLYKQLMIVITTFLVTTSIMILAYVVNYNKTLIENQLYSNAKNSASFLGLSISKSVNLDDKATIDGMLNSIVDTGFYESIKIYDIDEKLIADVKSSSQNIVPAWFDNLISLDKISSSANIMKNWQNLGHIEVATDSTYGKKKLYHTFIKIAQIFLISTILLLLILYIVISRLLKPLKRLSVQAKAIEKNEFIIEDRLPNTLEFKDVSIAMNKTISKLKDIVDKEINVLKKYNKLLYSDVQQERLGNRKYMLLKLDLYSRNSFGVICFFEIKNKQDLRHTLGYNKYAKFLDTIIDKFEKKFQHNSKMVMANMNADTLSILLPNTYLDEIKDDLDDVYTSIKSYIELKELESEFAINYAIGASSYSQKKNISQILINTNKALEDAFNKDEIKVAYYVEDDYLTKEYWETLLQRVFKNNEILFDTQNVVDIKNNSMYMKEYYTRLKDVNGTVYYPKEFLFGSDNSSLKQKLEQEIFKKIFQIASKSTKNSNIVINVSEDFVSHKDSVEWLLEELERFKNSATTFYFECLNTEVFNHQGEYEYFSKRLHKTQHRLGIESFAFENDNFDYLKVLKPAYLKVSKSYLTSDDGNISKDILENITISIGAELIIKHLETKEEYDKIKDLGVRFMQGYYIDTLEDK